ncbi:MAG: S8 family serine peptidase [Ardenticatenaceae bacterium]|nr:S8 family serine peptidase [Ardenticatenaceae bacterium]
MPVVIQMLRNPGQNETEALLRNWLTAVDTDWETVGDFQNIAGQVRLSDIPAIAARSDVFWINAQPERELMDEVQGQILAGSLNDSQTGPSGPGYLDWLASLGFSQNPADYPIVDITDDGIGDGTLDSGDPTLHELGDAANASRLAYIDNCTAAANGGGPDGHGHINVSIAGGYDGRTGAPYQDADGFLRGLGINPYGRFAGTRIFTDIFDLSACGNSDQELIQRTQDNGALISSNSWGCGGCAGSYDTSSQAYDMGVRDADPDEPGNQPVTFIFAAGNDGPYSGTVGTPGNGKNVITVGASETYRPTWIDGCNVSPFGADNVKDIIYFSSRGPAPGLRAKPELVAPGTHIQGTASTNADYNGSGVCDQFYPAGQTTFAASSGTSHSTPAVAGAASLYYYWLDNHYGFHSPSPALMKAYFIAHPAYLTGVSANDTLPSYNQGYGMPDMSLAFDDTPRYMLDETAVLDRTGQTWSYSSAVADPTKPVRIVMAYTDEPGLVGTSPQVNDLNLTVDWNDETYWGNHFSGAWSVAGWLADAKNNYEAVFLPLGTSGNFTVTVTAYTIAGDGLPGNDDMTDQDFALVCYNCSSDADFDLKAAPAEQTICTPDEAIYDVTVNELLGFSESVTLSASSIFTSSFSVNPIVADGQSQLTIGSTGGAAPGEHEVGITAVSPSTTHTTTVKLTLYDGLPESAALLTPVNGETAVSLTPTLTWQNSAQAELYYLEIAPEPDFITPIITATVQGTQYSIPSMLNALTTYYWRLRTQNACGEGDYSPTYTFTTELKACASPLLPVPDGFNEGITSEIAVSEMVTLSDLNIWLDISHTWVGDLTLLLEHVDTGTQVTLIDRPGVPDSVYGCYSDDIYATLDDNADDLVENVCNLTGAALSGVLKPMESLSAFNRELWSGTWRLSVIDAVVPDSGTLNNWCLLPTYTTPDLTYHIYLPLTID